MKDDDAKEPEVKKFFITVRRETLLESLRNDIVSLILLTGLVWLNEATFKSATLNFLFGLLGLISIIYWSYSRWQDKNISGTDKTELMARVSAEIDKHTL